MSKRLYGGPTGIDHQVLQQVSKYEKLHFVTPTGNENSAEVIKLKPTVVASTEEDEHIRRYYCELWTDFETIPLAIDSEPMCLKSKEDKTDKS